MCNAKPRDARLQPCSWLKLWQHLRTTLAMLLVATVLASVSWDPRPALAADQAPAITARPSTAGQLKVDGTHLTDADGNHVVLRGISTHGLQWYGQYVNDPLFGQLADEWDCNLIRLAMYSQDYCDGNQEQNLQVLRRGIEACIAHDMYVLVDWHNLEDADPNTHLDQAKEFFAQISSEYANDPHVIYEICNEPNGETEWADIREYAEQVIPVIRANSPQAVVIVGTPNFDRQLAHAARDPLAFDNVMYTLHFYVTSHGKDLRAELKSALAAGLPVFVTESGLSEASGDGAVDFESAVAWYTLLAKNDISFAVWSLSNKDETSALIRQNSEDYEHVEDADLTPVGLWVRSLIQGQDPATIPMPTLDQDGRPVNTEPIWARALNGRDLNSASAWPLFACVGLAALVLSLIWRLIRSRTKRGVRSYDDLVGSASALNSTHALACRLAIAASTFFSLVYLMWRVAYSMPIPFGWLPVAANVILLLVELLGFVESLVHNASMINMRDHPLPVIADEDYPDVDIFIATYNEPCDLLRRTINGCTHLKYPDRSKVHVWVCDDTRRPEMRALAKEMGVGYFDRPNNEGAKAGNLNHAMGLTSAPYVVTLDADMIVRSDFLLKTIPYFVDADRRSEELPEDERVYLGLLQTPQAFYTPDVFQHALYAEHRVTNEQDFFYRTIEKARTSTNSVIYGGSNTVLARRALEAVGGFFTETITEDFATGLMIESAGFVSLAISEPLASGRTPDNYTDHIKQRTRWGRGVINTARKLRLFTRPGLTMEQRLSYWSSKVYWYSPIKNLVYILAPLLYAVLGLPVFVCSWLDLVMYWVPMFIMQTLCLRVVSGNSISHHWSGIYETSVMPSLLAPIVKEALGMSMTRFVVTDKSGKTKQSGGERKDKMPFVLLLVLSAIGIVRICVGVSLTGAVGVLVLLFWLIRNAYYLLMALFLIDGRESDSEPVHVITAEPVVVGTSNEDGSERLYEGVATVLEEHRMRVYLDYATDLGLGVPVSVKLDTGTYEAEMGGAVVELIRSHDGRRVVHTIEILDYRQSELDYLQILYDRVPTLPQVLTRDYGVASNLWRNIAFRAARSVR